ATALLINKLFFMGYVLHANEAPIWARHFPRGRLSKTMHEVVAYLVGSWLLIGILTATYIGGHYLVTNPKGAESKTEEPSTTSADTNTVNATVAAKPNSRTVQIGKSAFVIGAAVGLFVLTPAISMLLFTASQKLRLSRVFGSTDNNEAHGLAV